MMQQTINNIESAQFDVQVFQALKVGDKVISELQSQVSMDKLEELYESHQEHLERQEMEQQMFGQVFDDEELQDELDKLDAEIAEMELG